MLLLNRDDGGVVHKMLDYHIGICRCEECLIVLEIVR